MTFNVGDKVRLWNHRNSGMELTIVHVLDEPHYPICVARDDEEKGKHFRVEAHEIRHMSA